jgi:capsular polysaccharide transport system ATP-binding protein
MMRMNDVHKFYPVRGGQVEVLKGINLSVARGERVGILGSNGAGKSTLIRLISGIEQPSSGTVERTMRVSWPLAFTGAFQGGLTGADNIRFICRIYNVAYEDVIDFVEDFSQLGRYLREPVGIYSSGMRARLGFAASMMIDFDCYLIDEVVSVGDSRFQARCQKELYDKRSDRALIIVSHDSNYLREHCNRACVLDKGVLSHFPNIHNAIHNYGIAMASQF